MKVSILIPTKDAPGRRERLQRCVKAAMLQDYDDVEIIVKQWVDDGWKRNDPLLDVNDPLLELRLNEPSLPWHRLFNMYSHDHSIACALNQATRGATGDIFHFACDDDEMLPDACSNAVAALKQHDAEWTYGVMHVVNYEDGQRNILTYIGGWAWDGSRLWQGGNYIPQPTVFWTRKAWDYCGPFDETLPLCFDFEFWARLGSLYTPVVRQHVDSYYEQWEGSISVARQDEQREEVSRAQKRWTDLGFGRRL